MNEDKRKFKRIHLDNLPVLFSIPDQIPQNTASFLKTFFMENLSYGGAYLLTAEDIPIPSQACIEFILPFNDLSLMADPRMTIEAKGVVLRKGIQDKEPQGIAIRFKEKPTAIYKPLV